MTKKRLTSDAEHSDNPNPESQGEKRLSAEDDAANSGKRLGNEQTATTNINEPVDPQGNTLKERIRSATDAGGLKKIPANFEDSDGDWIVCKSKNPFENLFLDYREYKHITPDIVERNYKILNDFWAAKINSMRMGANKGQIIRKYAGPDGSDRTILKYKNKLELAYKKLIETNGLQDTYVQVNNARQKMIREKLDPVIMLAMKDKTLSPQAEKTIKVFCRAHTDLSEEEISEIIEIYLKKTATKRVDDDSGVSESEKLFFHQIRKKLRKDQYLSRHEEEDLVADMDIYSITPERYEALVLKALKELDGAEREKTFEKDKKIFSGFYYMLLRNFGLTETDALPEEAVNKFVERDNSDTEFFPLTQAHRQEVISQTVQRYKGDLESEKRQFYSEALTKLDAYDGYVEMWQQLMEDKKYLLLLPEIRKELGHRAIGLIRERQAETFIKAIETYYQIKQWHISEAEKEQFIAIPNQLPHTKSLRYDWLDKKARTFLFQQTSNWAIKQYRQELSLIAQEINTALKKHIYGLPFAVQEAIETSKSYHLAAQERRNAIITSEAPHRKDAEKVFVGMVKKALVFNTLIPEREKELLAKGESELLLNTVKNQQSHPVRTADEIIGSLRQPFGKVMAELVAKETQNRKISDHLLKNFSLPYTACISQEDMERFVNYLHPQNQAERDTVIRAFKECAQQTSLEIVPSGDSSHFKNRILEPIVKEKSNRYRYKLSKWFNSAFRNDILNLGAAFGLNHAQVEKELNELDASYASWTRPRWRQFAAYFLIVAGGLLLLRLAAYPAGATDWSFIEPVQWHYLDFWGGMDYKAFESYEGWMAFPDFDFSGEHNGWAALFKIIAKIILLIIYLIWLVIALIINAIPLIIFAVKNAVLALYNIFAILSFLVGNLGFVLANTFLFLYYSVSFVITGADRVLFFRRSLNIAIPWCGFAGLFALGSAFIRSTYGLRRSYKISGILISAVLLASLASAAFFSIGNVKAAEKEITGAYQYFPEVKPETKIVQLSKMGFISFPRGAIIRSRPDRNSRQMTALPRGTGVEIISTENAWYKVAFNFGNQRKIGYVYNTLIEVGTSQNGAKDITEGYAAYAIVTSENMFVREGAGISSSIIDTLANETRLEILSEEGNWLNVDYSPANNPTNGRLRGYVYKQH